MKSQKNEPSRVHILRAGVKRGIAAMAGGDGLALLVERTGGEFFQ